MSRVLDDTIGTAKNVMENAKEGTEHAVSRARSTLLDGICAATQLFGMLRGFDFDRGLRWMGLARRTGPFHDLAVFSLGLAVGAGAGLLLAPVSGADARRAILDQMKGLKQDAKQTLDRAERKVEDKVAEGADAFKDKVDAAADAVKDKTDAVKDKLDATADAVKDKVESTGDAYPRVHPISDTSNRASSLSGPGNRHRMS